MSVECGKTDYEAFLAAKAKLATLAGLNISPREISPILKPFQKVIAAWALRGGRRAIFASFGLGKTLLQVEIIRLIIKHAGGEGLIVLPLGVRQEFTADAAMLGVEVKFIRSADEIEPGRIHLTNYETVRDGKLDPRLFTAASLDEAAVLRGFGGTKTFREFMRLFEDVRFRFVATATPDPNEYVELLAYAAFLGVMDVGEAKTRFFKRDSTQADKLTLHPHKEREFWLWVASWALFISKPSDLGFSDEGYELPELDVRWHELPSDHSRAGEEADGQVRMFRNSAKGVVEASAEKRDSLPARIGKMLELRAEDPDAHRLIWHDLEAERLAIEAAIPTVVSVYGSQKDEGPGSKEEAIVGFAYGSIQELAAKPVMLGAGCNFQRHCHWSIFLGIGFKFNDFIQAIHRLQRFLQTHQVRIDLIYTEAERETRRLLERRWSQHTEQRRIMSGIIKEYGLAEAAIARALERSIGVTRMEEKGERWTAVHNDCVDETRRMESDSVDLIVTSIPFATQYEYTPSYNDFGHTDDNDHFWRQMDFLTPELLRVLEPGRVAIIHVKDRIVPGGLTGLGFQTVQPFSDETIAHFRKHGFAFLARKTIVTDVVRENNQTYRLGWTEQCKDGSRMGCGMPEYLLYFRKPPTDRSNGYADTPVVKDKPLCLGADGIPAPFDKDRNWRRPVSGTGYSRGRWQFDAHGFSRSSGDRLLTSAELANLDHDQLFKLWRERSLQAVYNFENHVSVAEEMDALERLPSTFMLLPPHSWHPDVWTDVTRMLTLNGAQYAAGREMHLCLARGSLILTRAGFKPIEEMRVGDLVLTHKGRWRPVIAVQNTGVREVVTVRAQGVPGLTLTPDHRLWVRAVGSNAEARAHARSHAKKAHPDWIEARHTAGSYVNFKLPPENGDAQGDECLWWTVGRWIADGHMDTHGGAVISVGPHKIEEFQAHVGRFGGNPLHGKGSAKQILLRDRSRELRDILDRCGRGAANKHFPSEAFELPKHLAGALLRGYLAGDGHFIPSRRRWMATSISRDLIFGTALLAQRALGTIPSIHRGKQAGITTIEGRQVRTQAEWVVSFDVPDPCRNNRLPLILDDGAWKKVRSVEPAGEAETWNIRVEEDESYTAEGCVVKNCPLQFDIVDRAIVQFSMPGETVFDPFGGIMTVPVRAVKLDRYGIGVELNPSYWRDGVQHCKDAESQASMPSLFDLLEAEAAE